MKISRRMIAATILPLLILCGGVMVSGQKAELVVQTGHVTSVKQVAYSPNGRILASATDHIVKLWDATTGKELKTVGRGCDSINSIVFSPDSKTLAFGCENTVKLLDIASGKELKTLTGHTNSVESVAFSPDGRTLASGGWDKTIKLWDVISGLEVATLEGHTEPVRAVTFAHGGKMLASAGQHEKTVKLWDVAARAELRTFVGHADSIFSFAISPDSQMLATGSRDGSIKLWDVASGRERRSLKGHIGYANCVAFSPDGKTIVSAGGTPGYVTIRNKDNTLSPVPTDNAVRLWDLATGEEVKTLKGHRSSVESAVFSPDGLTVASGGYDTTVKLWDVATGRELRTLRGKTFNPYKMTITSDGRTFASGGMNESSLVIKLWKLAGGLSLKTLKLEVYANALAFSPDGKILASGSGLTTTRSAPSRAIKLWDVKSGRELMTLYGHRSHISLLVFSPDGKTLASGSTDGTARLWEVATGRDLGVLGGHTFAVYAIVFAPDRRTLLTAGDLNDAVRVWDLETLREVKVLKGVPGHSLALSKDGKTLAGENSKTVVLADVETGQVLKSLPGDDADTVRQVSEVVPEFYRKQSNPVTADDRFQFASGGDGRLNLYEFKTHKLLASLIALGEEDWAVITPDGLFDASAGARKSMHYIVGLEPVSLEQMKGAYYVPGLLSKIFDGEPLPKVELFSGADLFPLAEFAQPTADQKSFTVRLRNRGGGIGPVQVLVNGKEFVGDARPAGFDPNRAEATLRVSLAGAPIIAGGVNRIEIVTRNASGSLNSRGSPRGAEIVQVFNFGEQVRDPHLYAIVVGVSDYTGDNLDLSFAAADAEAFAAALAAGAGRLFGADRVHLRLLTSSGGRAGVRLDVADAKISFATKAEFVKAFEEFRGATPNDVFVVYMAGHGVSLDLGQGRSGGGDAYLFLTQEATTTDKSVLAVESVRRAMAISSDELTELMKHNKSLKQVLVLDTCAAGAAARSLIAKRDLSPDQIRAIERLKDRTGFFALMGAAADRVSYEASQYGQGLLTYSLLQGMKGARLRESQFADVSMLFSYAQDAVPEMARNIGGVQRPLVIAPDASGSFDIGRFTPDEQRRIALSAPRPLVLRPSLQNRDKDYDDLDLEAAFRQELRSASFLPRVGRGSAALVFVEADEMADAVKPSGSYIVEGDRIRVTLRLIRDRVPIKTMTFEGTLGEKQRLVSEMAAAVSRVGLAPAGGSK